MVEDCDPGRMQWAIRGQVREVRGEGEEGGGCAPKPILLSKPVGRHKDDSKNEMIKYLKISQ
jgi:hypothetical protein